MKIKFDSGQEFQRNAVQAVVDLFDGQPLAQKGFEIRLDSAPGELFTDLGFGNNLHVTEEGLIRNLRAVQARNGLPVSEELEGANFCIEMETGTGKTYVYLRSIYELASRYGFRKFIIVLPSVAIREGVWQTIGLTREHFAGLYDNLPVDAVVYQSKQVSRIRQFASSNLVQVLVMNIQAFASDATIVQRENDRMSGRRPVEFLQATNPIVIMDEPQNMESPKYTEAIASLNPLCTLRYSATHRNLYNQIYRLDPVMAYDLGLVKRIEVDSVIDEADFNKPYIHLQGVLATRSCVTARLELDVQAPSGPVRKSVRITKQGVDLYDVSGRRENYRGYVVEDILNLGSGRGEITFANRVTVRSGETHGGRTDEVMRVQVRQTIQEHLDKELAISRLPEGERMKVLSLFFIDRVANYANADGSIRRAFEEEFAAVRKHSKYDTLPEIPLGQLHDGYFARDKDGPKDTSGKSTADDAAYELIMRDKEKLLALETPLRFIFSHSALREGWDNPNVFQICTLNETRSELRKRQEIGRGLRLPVRENGERCFDTSINRLTVIANESYDDFARKLQAEIKEECGVSFAGRIKNKRERRRAHLRNDWSLDPDFLALWERIKHRTRYSVHYDTDELIRLAGERLKSSPAIRPPQIRVVSTELSFKSEPEGAVERIGGQVRRVRDMASGEHTWGKMPIPDLVTYLQAETELTRSTLVEILIRSDSLDEAVVNPQQFMDAALGAIRVTLQSLMVRGIKYERIADAVYEMLLFEEHEVNSYVDRLVAVEHSLYDYIEYDSPVERAFAEALDVREDIKLFIKLPRWFQVDTPLGTYNPDWAIVKEDSEKVYLVRETKGTTSWEALREAERQKIECGQRHFGALDVNYEWVESALRV